MDTVLLPVCIVGATSPRALLYAKALRRLSSATGGSSCEVELRVTCVCDANQEAREKLKRALCGEQPRLPAAAEDLEAIAEYEALDEVLICEEFGDFLCSAVVVLLESEPDRSVAVALEALKARKHVFLEPWAPALSTARRWGGFDDCFRRLWDGVRNGEEHALCFFSTSPRRMRGAVCSLDGSRNAWARLPG